jgi:aspartyl-tRNA(Asn)/glutamyl-tRNA(Gln) amidotransferase subunit B
MTFDDDYINKIKLEISELPSQKRERLSAEYNLSKTQAEILVHNPFLSDFFEESVSEMKSIVPEGNVEMVYNYITSDVKGIESEKGTALSESKLLPAHLGQLVALLSQNKISSRVAKDVLSKAFETGQSPEDIVNSEGLGQISDESGLEGIIRDIIDNNEKVCYDYKKGKENAMQFLVGQVMAKTRGKANPEVARQLLKKLLS